jgi:hypothetical protein
LEEVKHGYKQLHIVDTEENREALDIAYELISSGAAKGIEVDEAARSALQQEQSYVESLVAAGTLQKTRKIPLTEQQQHQIEFAFLR